MIKDMRVKDLKNIIEKLQDDLLVIIPVINEDDANEIIGFRKVRTAGILTCEYEDDTEALCLNASADEQNIADQVYFSGKGSEVGVKEILFGYSKYEER